MSEAAKIDRPTRWDAAFDADMSDADFEMLMARPEISEIESSSFFFKKATYRRFFFKFFRFSK